MYTFGKDSVYMSTWSNSVYISTLSVLIIVTVSVILWRSSISPRIRLVRCSRGTQRWHLHLYPRKSCKWVAETGKVGNMPGWRTCWHGTQKGGPGDGTIIHARVPVELSTRVCCVLH